MKNILINLLLGSCLIGTSSCNNEDEIEISHLYGKWAKVYKEDNLMVSGSITYTFNRDNTFIVNNYDYFSQSEIIVYGDTVFISNDNKLLTLYTNMEEYPRLYNEEYPYNNQYRILKLTSKEMTLWEVRDGYDSHTGKKKLHYFNK